MSEIKSPFSKDVPPPPEALQGLKYPHLYSPFGFRIVEIDGQAMWTLATEQEYKEANARRLGIPPADFKVKRICRLSGPTTCHPDGCCAIFYDPQNKYYYCSC